MSSCKEGKLKIYFYRTDEEIDSTLRLDFFRLIRINTLTQKDMYTGMILQLNSHKETIIEDMQKLLEEMKHNAKMVNLAKEADYGY